MRFGLPFLLFICFQTSAWASLDQVSESRSSLLLASEIEHISNRLVKMADEMSEIEAKVQDLDAKTAEIDTLSVRLEQISQRQTDALMDISNVVANSNNVLEVANASIDNAGNYLGYSSLILAALAIGAAIYAHLAQRRAEEADERIVRQLVSKLKEYNNDRGTNIIDELKLEIREEVRDDLTSEVQESASLAVNSEDFVGTLKRLVREAVKAEKGGSQDTEDSSDDSYKFSSDGEGR